MCTFSTTSLGTRSVDLLERRDDDEADLVALDDLVVAVAAAAGGGGCSLDAGVDVDDWVCESSVTGEEPVDSPIGFGGANASGVTVCDGADGKDCC